MIKQDGSFAFELFASQKGFIQAVSSRRLGDMTDINQNRRLGNRQRFLNSLGLETNDLVTMEQVHRSRVKMVRGVDRGREITGVDGLVTQDEGLVLAVKTADCASLVAFDPENLVLGVAHAGWRGTLKKIGYHLVEKMKRLGAKPTRLLVGIGPHIGPCCYRIKKDRATQFLAGFGNLAEMVGKKGDDFYLNLSVPIIWQLTKAGVLEENIEVADLCTFCRQKEFFSFRREGRPVGGFLTVAAMTKQR